MDRPPARPPIEHDNTKHQNASNYPCLRCCGS